MDLPTQMILTEREDGTVWADNFPTVIEIARELLVNPPLPFVTRRFRAVRINLANGDARYRLQSREPGGYSYLARLERVL